MSNKKIERLRQVIDYARSFQLCEPSSDVTTEIATEYYSILTTIQKLATPLLPSHIAEQLNSLSIDIESIYSVYEAKPILDTLLFDIEEILDNTDASILKTKYLITQTHLF